jgi:hypothetical protein
LAPPENAAGHFDPPIRFIGHCKKRAIVDSFNAWTMQASVDEEKAPNEAGIENHLRSQSGDGEAAFDGIIS